MLLVRSLRKSPELQLYDILDHSFELWEPPPSSVLNGKYASRSPSHRSLILRKKTWGGNWCRPDTHG